jgi:hypothetical protein
MLENMTLVSCLELCKYMPLYKNMKMDNNYKSEDVTLETFEITKE